MTNYDNFFQLHHQQEPLIIGNAWNVKSAQLIENNGFKAIATSSGAIASSLGYDDGEKIPFSELLYIVQRIRSCTTIPLSVDMERGYTNDLTALNDNIQKLIDIGVAGINLEDPQGEEIYLRKLHGIKNYLTKTSQALFINARTDVFLQKLELPLETTLKRAGLYKEAGADGLFVPGVQDAAVAKEIASAIKLPLNMVATPKLPSVEVLSACGVKRISMAVNLYKATYNQLDRSIKEIHSQRSFAVLF